MRAAIAQLYRVFAPYRLGDDFVGCECCVSPADSARLAAIPLRELTVCDLNRYAFKAMSTWGEQRHFKHFLPRLLELTLDEFLSFNDPEVLLGKLAYANWQSWPPHEREAVASFLDVFWRRQLSLTGQFPWDDRVRTALGGLAEATPSLKPYLYSWTRTCIETSALHLAQLIHSEADEIMTTGTLRLWSEPGQQSRELCEWLSSDEPHSLLNAYRETVSAVFPLVFAQLAGVRAAMTIQ